MNHEHESLEDPTPDTDSREALERLAEIERQLKKARPRPLRLDVAAIERLARETMMPAAAERPAPAATRRRWWTGGRWPDRRTVAIAGSWACGAAVGALVTFVLMSHTVSGTNPTAPPSQQSPTSPTRDRDAPATADRETERRNEPIAPSLQKTTLDSDAAALAMVIDRFRNEDLASGQEGPTLFAGMHLRDAAAGPSSPGDDMAMEPQTNDSPPDAAAQKRPRLYPDQAPATTRGRLLHELLQAPGSIL